jgi:hypothetical protein
MPVTDYSKTIIYVIKCHDDNITEEYVGSTTNFRSRKSSHKNSCINENHGHFNSLKSKFIRENGGWENWMMIQLEEFPCENKRQAECREEELRFERKARLNSHRAFRTKEQIKEYKMNYKTEHKEQIKNWLEENKNNHKEYRKQYRLEHQNRIKEQMKKYYEENKDYLNEKNKVNNKKYYELNKEQIREKRKNKRNNN